jgi:tellurite resistance protein TerC
MDATLESQPDPGLVSAGSPALWAVFLGLVSGMLALDLGVFHRQAREIGFRGALAWSAVWFTLALIFGAYVTWHFGSARGIEFFTGYLIEQSLSIDNLFVFLVLFASLRIPPSLQHRVLFWVILSALFLRAAMIFAGAALLSHFHGLFYVFGGFLVLTGVKLFLQRNKDQRLESTWTLRVVQRMVPSTPRFHGTRFLAREDGRLRATPLFMALVLIELTDLVFAVDSIPAVFAVTSDPFIVFTSNIFAVLGMRSLFFVLGNLMERFRYLKIGLSVVLVFVGLKMSVVDLYKIPPLVSLLVVLLVLGVAMATSLGADRVAAREGPHEG